MNLLFLMMGKIDQNEAFRKRGYWTYGKWFKQISHNFVPCTTKVSKMLFEDCLKPRKNKGKWYSI